MISKPPRGAGTNPIKAIRPPAVGVHYDLSTRGAMLHLDLEGGGATVVVGDGDASVEIEVSPTGPLPGDYFVGTFDGPRITALVHLGEDYELVRPIDLVQMVQAERDVSDFPSIAVVGQDGARRLVVLGGGAPARLELHGPLGPAEQDTHGEELACA